MDEGQLLLLWPGEVRRKREGDFGQIGPALLAGTNNRPSFINKIPSTSYCNIIKRTAHGLKPKVRIELNRTFVRLKEFKAHVRLSSVTH